jgi:GGDEF domain-containing protein
VELARVARTGEPLAVGIVDLDLFKRFDDTLGHQAGDLLLRDAVRAWQAELRAADLLARLGGEESAVLLPGCDAERAQATVERSRSSCRPGRRGRARGDPRGAVLLGGDRRAPPGGDGRRARRAGRRGPLRRQARGTRPPRAHAAARRLTEDARPAART